MIKLPEIKKTFAQHAYQYEQSAKIQHEIGQRLFKRLAYLSMTPTTILDLGCGTGVLSAQLKQHYPKALIIGLDLAFEMLQCSQKKQHFWRKWPLVQADMHGLPFADNTFDLIISNQVIHWSPTLLVLFKELYRIMRAESCLMFSTLGPDTFQEINQAWQHDTLCRHTNEFRDMHDIGDILLTAHFADPVVDMERLKARYSSLHDLFQGLKAQGVKNIHPRRHPGLTGKKNWQRFITNYPQEQGKFSLSYEVVYGQAWKVAPIKSASAQETYIPVNSIQKLKR